MGGFYRVDKIEHYAKFQSDLEWLDDLPTSHSNNVMITICVTLVSTKRAIRPGFISILKYNAIPRSS